MIRAYDDYGNVVDLVEWEKQIRADALREVEEAMYHECFEVNHYKDGLQRWDSGNWFRYKLFENVMEKLKEGEQNEE